MIPTAINTGIGAEFRAPMAIAVIGGVLSSTVLTLLVVPVVFVQMERFSSFLTRIYHYISPPQEDEELQTRPMNPEANVSGEGSEGAAK
jgi:HAE1 family hydrophobic/amphiphilic exporter-1